MKISPSILSANFLNFKESIDKILSCKNIHSIHIDVMDGVFVPNITIGHQIIKPLKETYPQFLVDAHLMVIDPEKHVDSFIDSGVDFLSFHIEASRHPQRLLQYIRSKGVKAGLAINPATPLDNISYILESADFIIVMTVNPGFSGQDFIPSMLKKIKQLRTMTELDIIVDGGVNINNILKLEQLGVNTVVAGSAVFSHLDPKKAINELLAKVADVKI